MAPNGLEVVGMGNGCGPAPSVSAETLRARGGFFVGAHSHHPGALSFLPLVGGRGHGLKVCHLERPAGDDELGPRAIGGTVLARKFSCV